MNPDRSGLDTVPRCGGVRRRAFCRAASPNLGIAFLCDRDGGVALANPVAIFLAGCRECLPEWEIQVAGWPRCVRLTTAIPRTRTRSFAHVGKVVEGQNAETADSPRAQRQPTGARRRPASARTPRGKP